MIGSLSTKQDPRLAGNVVDDRFGILGRINLPWTVTESTPAQQTSYSMVFLINKSERYQTVKDITGLGLKEAKTLVENPQVSLKRI